MRTSKQYKQTSYNQNNSRLALKTTSDNDTITISKKMFGKGILKGTIENIDYNIQKTNKFDIYTSVYEGTIADKTASLEIKRGWNIFKPDTITGTIGGKEINLSIKQGLFGNATKITGEYDGDAIDLAMESSMLGNKYTLVGENTNYSIGSKCLSFNMKANGNFEYNPEILPILYAYTKEEIARNYE